MSNEELQAQDGDYEEYEEVNNYEEEAEDEEPADEVYEEDEYEEEEEPYDDEEYEEEYDEDYPEEEEYPEDAYAEELPMPSVEDDRLNALLGRLEAVNYRGGVGVFPYTLAEITRLRDETLKNTIQNQITYNNTIFNEMNRLRDDVTRGYSDGNLRYEIMQLRQDIKGSYPPAVPSAPLSAGGYNPEVAALRDEMNGIKNQNQIRSEISHLRKEIRRESDLKEKEKETKSDIERLKAQIDALKKKNNHGVPSNFKDGDFHSAPLDKPFSAQTDGQVLREISKVRDDLLAALGSFASAFQKINEKGDASAAANKENFDNILAEFNKLSSNIAASATLSDGKISGSVTELVKKIDALCADSAIGKERSVDAAVKLDALNYALKETRDESFTRTIDDNKRAADMTARLDALNFAVKGIKDELAAREGGDKELTAGVAAKLDALKYAVQDIKEESSAYAAGVGETSAGISADLEALNSAVKEIKEELASHAYDGTELASDITARLETLNDTVKDMRSEREADDKEFAADVAARLDALRYAVGDIKDESSVRAEGERERSVNIADKLDVLNYAVKSAVEDFAARETGGKESSAGITARLDGLQSAFKEITEEFVARADGDTEIAVDIAAKLDALKYAVQDIKDESAEQNTDERERSVNIAAKLDALNYAVKSAGENSAARAGGDWQSAVGITARLDDLNSAIKDVTEELVARSGDDKVNSAGVAARLDALNAAVKEVKEELSASKASDTERSAAVAAQLEQLTYTVNDVRDVFAAVPALMTAEEADKHAADIMAHNTGIFADILSEINNISDKIADAAERADADAAERKETAAHSAKDDYALTLAETKEYVQQNAIMLDNIVFEVNKLAETVKNAPPPAENPVFDDTQFLDRLDELSERLDKISGDQEKQYITLSALAAASAESDSDLSEEDEKERRQTAAIVAAEAAQNSAKAGFDTLAKYIAELRSDFFGMRDEIIGRTDDQMQVMSQLFIDEVTALKTALPDLSELTLNSGLRHTEVMAAVSELKDSYSAYESDKPDEPDTDLTAVLEEINLLRQDVVRRQAVDGITQSVSEADGKFIESFSALVTDDLDYLKEELRAAKELITGNDSEGIAASIAELRAVLEQNAAAPEERLGQILTSVDGLRQDLTASLDLSASLNEIQSNIAYLSEQLETLAERPADAAPGEIDTAALAESVSDAVIRRLPPQAELDTAALAHKISDAVIYRIPQTVGADGTIDISALAGLVSDAVIARMPAQKISAAEELALEIYDQINMNIEELRGELESQKERSADNRRELLDAIARAEQAYTSARAFSDSPVSQVDLAPLKSEIAALRGDIAERMLPDTFTILDTLKDIQSEMKAGITEQGAAQTEAIYSQLEALQTDVYEYTARPAVDAHALGAIAKALRSVKESVIFSLYRSNLYAENLTEQLYYISDQLCTVDADISDKAAGGVSNEEVIKNLRGQVDLLRSDMTSRIMSDADAFTIVGKELKAVQAELKTAAAAKPAVDIKSEFKNVRADLSSDLKSVKNDLSANVKSALSAALKENAAALQSGVKEQLKEVSATLKTLKADITKASVGGQEIDEKRILKELANIRSEIAAAKTSAKTAPSAAAVGSKSESAVTIGELKKDLADLAEVVRNNKPKAKPTVKKTASASKPSGANAEAKPASAKETKEEAHSKKTEQTAQAVTVLEPVENAAETPPPSAPTLQKLQASSLTITQTNYDGQKLQQSEASYAIDHPIRLADLAKQLLPDALQDPIDKNERNNKKKPE